MLNTEIIKDPNSERYHLNWKECNSQSLEGNVDQKQRARSKSVTSW